MTSYWAANGLNHSIASGALPLIGPTPAELVERLAKLAPLERLGKPEDIAAAEQSTMGVYTHFGSKQGLLEQLYLHGFRRLEDRLNSVPSDGHGRQELLAFALADRISVLAEGGLGAVRA